MPITTVWFDGSCPLCSREIALMRRLNRSGRVAFVVVSDSAAGCPLDQSTLLQRFHTARIGSWAKAKTVGERRWGGERDYRGTATAGPLDGLDILVSNAGRQQSPASILEVSDEDFDATNTYAPFYVIKAALPNLKPGSAIIATTSEQAYDPSPDLYD